MARPTPSTATCPVARSAELLGDRWSLLIIRDAFDGVSRFSDFQRSLGMARNVLSERLKRLVDADILHTCPAEPDSAYHRYELTAAGQTLFPLVVALRQWGEAHLFTADEEHSQLLDIENGLPLAPMQPLDARGAPLSAAQTRVEKPH